jgi:hypothetical protein
MPSFCRNDVILVAYPFSDRTGIKVRPAVVVSGEHRHESLVIKMVGRLVSDDASRVDAALRRWLNL